MASFFATTLYTVFSLYGLCLIAETFRKAVYIYRQTRNSCKPPQKIRQSPFLFGIDWLLNFSRSARNGHFLTDHRREHELFGETFTLDVLGATIIHTSNPENIKHILSLQFHDFDMGPVRRRAFAPLLGNGIFTSDGATWSHSRRAAKASLTRQRLISAFPLFEKHTQRFFSKIPRDCSPIDVQPLLLQLTMDTSTEFLFGRPIAVQQLPSEFSDAFEDAQAGMAVRARLGPLMDLFFRNSRFSESCRLLHLVVDTYIASVLGRSRERNEDAFLVELTQHDGSPNQLRDHILNLLVAGRDTTAGLISIALYAVSRHPRIWTKLQAELAGLDGRPPSIEQLKNMQYLSWVVKETLRLWPTTPIISRTANKDTILPRGGGSDGSSSLFIPKGQRIALSFHAMHRQKTIFGDDASTFRPERWNEFRRGWNYLPFSGGPRVCIGQQFATVEASYVLVRLMQEFSAIEPRDEEPFQERLGLTLASKRGTWLILTPRSHGKSYMQAAT